MKGSAPDARRLAVCGLATACAVLAPGRAEAHLVTTGLGPVYDGISHVLMSPDDLVPVLAMSLLAGSNGARAGRMTLCSLTVAWLAAGAAGFLFGRTLLPVAVTSASFLILGGLTAADRRLSPAVVTGLAAAVGLLHGWMNGAAIAESGSSALGLAGIAATVFVCVSLVSALVIPLRTAWLRIVVRVAGSWVAAIGLLMIGWAMRGR